MLSGIGPARDLRVLIDTCSLMRACEDLGADAADFFREHFSDVVRQSGAKLIVPREVGRELERNKVRLPDEKARRAAEQALSVVDTLCREDIVEIRGEDGDTFPDNLFQQIIIRHCLRHAFCLVTQDRALAGDVLSLGQRQSVSRAKPIIVLRIAAGGLDRWEQAPDGNLTVIPVIRRRTPPHEPASVKFRLAQGPARVMPSLLAVSIIPCQGDVVRDDQGQKHRLASALGGGGEGKVYLTDTGLACKVYDRSRLTEGVKAKLGLMTQVQVQQQGLCWPKSIAMNATGEFVGYLMDRAQGRELQKTLFISFVFPVKDRIFYKQQGSSPPKRCEACRRAKKDREQDNGGSLFGGIFRGLFGS